jgi:hypothetical protein
MDAALLTPAQVLQQVADALPDACKANVIIVGSLAAGYYFFANSGEDAIRTKDVDCLLAPYASAVPVAEDVAAALLSAGWTLPTEGEWRQPGTEQTPEKELPLVRLYPPGDTKQWFAELLSTSADEPPSRTDRQFQRLNTPLGHFALCSFGYLGVVEVDSVETPMGLRIAHPAMMALANLLHHQEIGPTVMSQPLNERQIKRANKDLGRVLSLAYLSTEKDRDALDTWAPMWIQAFKRVLPKEREHLQPAVGQGLRALLKSDADMDEAWFTCQYGLLNSRRVSVDQLKATGERVLAEVVEVLGGR